MANFLEALGRSQAVTSAISGIQGIQQGELAIQNAKTQQAITEHAFKKIQEEEAAANRLIPIDPILNKQTPSVKKFWEEIGQPYFQTGASGGKYVRQKDMASIMGIMQNDISFRVMSDQYALKDYKDQYAQLQNQLNQAMSGGEDGKQKVDEKQIATIKQQMNATWGHITGIDQAQDQTRINLLKQYPGEQVDMFMKTGDAKYLGKTLDQIKEDQKSVVETEQKINERVMKEEETALKQTQQQEEVNRIISGESPRTLEEYKASKTKEESTRTWHNDSEQILRNHFGTMTIHGIVIDPERMKDYNKALTLLEKYRVKGLDPNTGAAKAYQEVTGTLPKAEGIGNAAPSPDRLEKSTQIPEQKWSNPIKPKQTQPPAGAISLLKQNSGKDVEFSNGQVWRWENGKAIRVK